jgi:hypothetical protein
VVVKLWEDLMKNFLCALVVLGAVTIAHAADKILLQASVGQPLTHKYCDARGCYNSNLQSGCFVHEFTSGVMVICNGRYPTKYDDRHSLQFAEYITDWMPVAADGSFKHESILHYPEIPGFGDFAQQFVFAGNVKLSGANKVLNISQFEIRRGMVKPGEQLPLEIGNTAAASGALKEMNRTAQVEVVFKDKEVCRKDSRARAEQKAFEEWCDLRGFKKATWQSTDKYCEWDSSWGYVAKYKFYCEGE